MVKNLPANVGDRSPITGLGGSPGEANDNPLQYPCLGNPMDRRTQWATVHAVAKSPTRLSDWSELRLLFLFPTINTKSSSLYLMSSSTWPWFFDSSAWQTFEALCVSSSVPEIQKYRKNAQSLPQRSGRGRELTFVKCPLLPGCMLGFLYYLI